ncbi:hypothetical protein ACEPAG_4580 [Sanghuangporus baumii]
MSFPVEKSLAIQFAYDLRAAMSLGYLRDVPVGSSLQSRYNKQYEVHIGPHKEPLQEVDYAKFSAACTLLFVGVDKSKPNPMYATYSKDEMYFYDREGSRALLKYHARRLLERHGFTGEFKLALKGLRMFGKGCSGIQLSSPDDEYRPGVIGGLLVDYPFDYRGGKINVTRNSQTESFDFAKTCYTDNMVSALLWHSGSLVEIEPLKKGLRAFLLCDVLVDPNAPAPLFLNPRSDIMRNFENDVVRNKSCVMPLVRMLVRKYWNSPQTAPGHFTSLCTHVVESYLQRLRNAIRSEDIRSEKVRSQARAEGKEIILSFGRVDNMRRFLGEHRVVDFMHYHKKLEQ